MGEHRNDILEDTRGVSAACLTGYSANTSRRCNVVCLALAEYIIRSDLYTSMNV